VKRDFRQEALKKRKKRRKLLLKPFNRKLGRAALARFSNVLVYTLSVRKSSDPRMDCIPIKRLIEEKCTTAVCQMS
jgi:hypothetical protein